MKNKISHFKGKTWEEIYGIKKTKLLKENQSKRIKGTVSTRKGKSYKEIYGIKKAQEIKKQASKKLKGKLKGISYEQKYGLKRANIMKRKMSKTRKGKTYEQKYGIKKANKIREKLSKNIKIKWTKETLETKLKIIKKEYKYVNKKIIEDLSHQNRWICNIRGIKNTFGSLENLTKETGLKIYNAIRIGNIGSNEKEILDIIEKQEGINLVRQYYTAGYFVDAANLEKKEFVEVDELYHNSQKVQDLFRENKILKVNPGFSFKRINEEEFLLKYRNKSLNNFGI